MSSFLIAAPEAVAAASADLSGIGEALKDATAAAGSSTTQLVPAAADEISGVGGAGCHSYFGLANGSAGQSSS